MVVDRCISGLRELSMSCSTFRFLVKFKQSGGRNPYTHGTRSNLGQGKPTWPPSTDFVCRGNPRLHRLIKIYAPFFDLLFDGMHDTCVRKVGG